VKQQEPDHPDFSHTTTGLTDADVRNTMLASIRLLAVLAVVAAALFWWKSSWQSAVLVLVGAVISAASLWEWLRLMTAINQRMDAGATPRPMGMILFGFFARLGLTGLALYGSLKYLHGTVFALAAGLGLGLFALTVEALRLLKRTTI
jgi:Na+/H+-translocating membrane pyrophosphatase